MSIPLIQDNQKDSINASLIAIKREEERLQALIAEADKKIAQLNELKVNKSDIVDEVTLNNMQSVTSNAVAVATQVVLNQNIQLESGFTVLEYCRYSKIGRLVIVDIGGLKSSSAGSSKIWARHLPIIRTRFVQQLFKDDYNTSINATVYGNLGTTEAKGHFPSTYPLYGNFVYITD